MKHLKTILCACLLAQAGMRSFAADFSTSPSSTWKIGTPVVTYWCGPTVTDAVAQQMAEGGWNLVWCSEQGLDVAQRHGLRGQVENGLLTPSTLEDPKRLAELDAFIGRVSKHPAFYSYHITDEPGAGQFVALGKLVTHLREKDPAHLAYINLFPTYASNEQLGTKGAPIPAYKEYLARFIDGVKPGLLSYDHYQFSLAGDSADYFLNLALVRRASLDANVPFLNIVQASTWAPKVMRVPGPDEMRYLVYTTLAYGAQGISYYIYTCANHLGGIANADGTPTVLYPALKTLNHEFVAIARELQALRSLGVYHAGMLPPGAEAWREDGPLRLDPPIAAMKYKSPERVRGSLLGAFGAQANSAATHYVVVNLDYKTEQVVGLIGQPGIELFDATTGRWGSGHGGRIEIKLPGGSGKLIRLK
ncbi:MAG TPA: hypothetical protein VMZ27_09910 [Candidatus Saccharimonadales bacterium]|nr:hypothetical protein [Candidatus Saccharimonadales bacterium]